jgi:hypothetical protein
VLPGLRFCRMNRAALVLPGLRFCSMHSRLIQDCSNLYVSCLFCFMGNNILICGLQFSLTSSYLLEFHKECIFGCFD